MSRSNSPDRITPTVVTGVNAARAERQAVKVLATELQTIIDSITGATTLGDLRGYVKDLTRTTRRLLRAVT